jgi:serine protease Do
MSRPSIAFIGLTGVVSFLLGLVVASTRPPLPVSRFPPPATPGGEGSGAPPLDVSRSAAAPAGAPDEVVDFAAVTARVNTAVVNVDTASRGREPSPHVRRYSMDDVADGPREGSGSGFIIDASGFILTNHHVVADADRVTVTLGDGRSFRADIIGVDPAIDVALLRIHAPDPLPVAPLGDSASLRVGEWVCAIGNPLGVYVHSVTVGVVSFLGRKLFDPSLDAYIQTDAAISFGNSGGPLINARGQVVGITTAISAQASNIGFAIPINQVVAVLPQLRERGAVSRGYIGIGLTNLTAPLRKALGIVPDHGALVQDVQPDTPAEHAGLRPYDVITGADGRTIHSDEELIRYISSRRPGMIAALDIWREGTMRTADVKLRDRPLPGAMVTRPARDADVRPATQDATPLGIRVRDIDPAMAGRLRLPDTLQGVLITDVDPAGPGRLGQLRTNQVILEINRRRVPNVADYRAAVAALRPGDAAAVLVYDRTTASRVICTVVADPEP